MTFGLPVARSVTTPTPHRGFAFLLAAALALITAVILVRVEALLAEPSVGMARDAAATNEAVVRRYYAAANTAIATGDIGGLTAVVSPDLVLPPGMTAPMTGHEALRERFRALHTANPALRIVVQDIVADENDVIARVALEGAGPGVPPAVQFSQFDADWLDGFRVQRGTIVAAWGATTGLSAPHLVLVTDIRAEHASEPVIGLTRLTLGPGAHTPVLIGPGPIVVAPEAPSLQVRIAGLGRLTRAVAGAPQKPVMTEAAVPIMLGPGDQVVVDAGVSFTLHNSEDEPVAALISAVYPATTFDSVSFVNAGIETRALSVAIFEPVSPAFADDAFFWEPLARETVAVPPGHYQLAVEQVVVSPGAVIPTFQPSETMLMAVELGMLVADVARGPIERVPMTITLIAGEGATVLPQDVAASLRNVSDVATVVLVVSIRPSPPAPAGTHG